MCPITQTVCRRTLQTPGQMFSQVPTTRRRTVADPVQEDRRSDETKTDYMKLVYGNHASGLQEKATYYSFHTSSLDRFFTFKILT